MSQGSGSRSNLRDLLRRSAFAMLALQCAWLPLSHAAAVWRFPGPTPDSPIFQLGYSLANLLGLMDGDSQATSWAPARVGLVVSFLIFAAMTALTLNVMRKLRAGAHELDAATVARIAKWAFAFSILPIAMLPNGPTDFWVYITWGRMFAADLSPYHSLPGAEHMAGVLVEGVNHLNPYGPLWSLWATAIARLTHGSVWVDILLAKTGAAAMWCGLIALVRYAQRDQPLYDQAMAVLWVGWLPASWLYVVAEGHNDVLMALGIVGWLALLRRGRVTYATLPLVASVLAKYVSLPFLAIDAWLALRARGRDRRAYFAALIGSLAFGATLFAIFSDGGSLFGAHLQTERIRALSPSFAARQIFVFFGFHAPAKYYDILVSALILIPAVPVGLRFLRTPRFEDAALLVLAALIFVFAVPLWHTWPWYTTWFLPVAALLWRTGYARAVLPIVLLAPIPNISWWNWQWSESATIVWWTAYPVVLLALLRSGLLDAPTGESRAVHADATPH